MLGVSCLVYTDIPNLNQQLGNSKFVYNHFLNLKMQEYEKWKSKGKPKNFKWSSFFDCIYHLPALKQEYEFLQGSDSQALQAVVKDLFYAFDNWFTGRGKYPRFKNKASKLSIRIPGQRLQVLETNAKYAWLKVPRILSTCYTDSSSRGWGKLKLRLPRDLPKDYKICYATISKTSTGKVTLSLTLEVDPITKLRKNDYKVGIDVGVKIPLALAIQKPSGKVVYKKVGCEQNKVLLAKEAKRKRYQRAAARKQLAFNKRKKSAPVDKKTGEIIYPSRKNLDKAYLKVAKAFEKERNYRKNWVEQTSHKLASNCQVIKFENLSLGNMTRAVKRNADGSPRKGVKAKSTLNCLMLRMGLASLVARTIVKANYYDSSVRFVDPKFTSQRCSCCGHIDKKSRVSQSKFICTSCGHSQNADKNAALNILRRKPLPNAKLAKGRKSKAKSRRH